MIGPGEAFLLNLGTIIKSLQPPIPDPSAGPTTAATHVSIVAFTSTVARILFGTLTDRFAPKLGGHYHLGDSISSLPPNGTRPGISRITFLICSALSLLLGQLLLGSGLIQGHANLFWIVSTLMGSGYGAIYSLTPLIITVIWGVENFGTNWGIVAMVPAAGATFWGIVYSTVYQQGADNAPPTGSEADDVMCYGTQCYQTTFLAMSASVGLGCVLWLWAWKGRNGWSSRGIAL